SIDHTDVARERSIDPDKRLDTLVHFKANQTWEFALANGNYEVTVSVGDPGVTSNYTLNVEGQAYWNAQNLAAGDYRVQTQQVTVSDGRLTLDQGAAANMSTRIQYVHIVGLPNGANDAPSAPNITEPSVDGFVAHPADVHMEAVGFSDPNSDGHKSTDWVI